MNIPCGIKEKLAPFYPSSSEDDDSLGNVGIIIGKDAEIAARYKKLQKERRQMKRDAAAEIQRLQRLVNGQWKISCGHSVEEKNKKKKKRSKNKNKQQQQQQQQQQKKELGREGGREEAEFTTGKKEKPRGGEESAREVDAAMPRRPSTTLSAERARKRNANRPSRYIGISSPRKNQYTKSPMDGACPRPDWCNSKGPLRHKKATGLNSIRKSALMRDYLSSHPNPIDDLEEVQRQKKSTGHVNPKQGRRRQSNPAVSSSDDSDEDESFDSSKVNETSPYQGAAARKMPSCFLTANEKIALEKKRRLASNRAALGLDGGLNRPHHSYYQQQQQQQQQQQEKKHKEQKHQPSFQQEYHSSSSKSTQSHKPTYSDPLEAELQKFRERAQREKGKSAVLSFQFFLTSSLSFTTCAQF